MRLSAALARLTTISMALTALAVIPLPANALVPPECETTILKGDTAATESQVEITSSGIYCVAKFVAVANDFSFVVPPGISKLDYLVVAGGGGGGSGGGGGGGVLAGKDLSVTPGSTIAITVGAGGTGGSGGRGAKIAATKGGDSKFGAIIAKGGGAGATEGIAGNVDGGSGGGSQFDCVSSSCGAAIAGNGTVGQGNNGGYSTYNSYGAGGGGGGAGGAGFNTTRLYIGANGGIGLASDITGTETYYGGGGGGGINNNSGQYVGLDANGGEIYSGYTPQTTGGGQGGLGGGGRGSSFGAGGSSGYANATDGAPNTGGGGGGTDPEDIDAGDGGSGVVIARWISNTNLKTVTFNSNFGSAITTTQKVGSGVATPLAINGFTRTGYVFSGWTTSADGSGSFYEDQQTVTISSDVTLYAKWLAGVTHSVTFNANGGSGTMPNQVSGISTNLAPNSLTRTGYTFNGWNTQANGSGFAYSDQAIYSFADDVTLYAQWQPIVATFKVTFYGNAATSGSTATQTASSSTALNLNGFIRTGYNFLGWNETYNSNVATFKDGQNYSFTADKNLYAIWVPQTNNDIVFDGNTNTGGSMTNQTASSSTRLNPNSFTKTGFTFLNWNTQANGSGVNYQSNYSYSFAAGLTLYAQWGQNVTVNFDANGANSGTAPGAQATFAGSPGINLPLNTGTLVKRGYRLAGWNTEPDGTGTPYALGASSVKFSANTVLYAHWTAATYSVIYSGNGASAGTEPSPQTFTYGTAVNLNDNSGALAKDGYTFSGWNTSPDGSGTTFAPTESNVSLSGDTVLFAKWSRVGGANNDSYTQVNPPQTPITVTKKKPVKITISGFGNSTAEIRATMLARIQKFLDANKGYSKVSTVGYAFGKPPTARMSKLSAARSKAVADLISNMIVATGTKATVLRNPPLKRLSMTHVTVTLSDD